MHAFGLLLFVLSIPSAVVGLCDSNTTRGNVLALSAALALPGGLLLAAS